MLRPERSTEVIEKRDRIVLVVPYSATTCLFCFGDKTFVHYDRRSQTVLAEGKLPVVPTKHLPSQRRGRIVLLGLDDSKSLHAVCMRVS
jgi:hypothetical protein